MGQRQYTVGRRHGLEAMPKLHHRAGKPYDGTTANECYEAGYARGLRERIRGASPNYDLFEMHGVYAPRRPR
jgi:hypothetical protein